MKRMIIISITCLILLLTSACEKSENKGNATNIAGEPMNGMTNINEVMNEGIDTSSAWDDMQISGSSGMESGTDTKSNEENNKQNQSPNNSEENAQAREMKKLFGESCIGEQTFEVTLSEYDGKVFFVPFAPSKENPDLHIQIIQNGNVLAELRSFVPTKLTGEEFSSLDAVSFFDVNFDGYTDIVLVETYGNTIFTAIYYGFAQDASDYEKYFFLQDQLSESVSDQLEVITMSEIRSFLTDGKKNGEFSSYKEAYLAVCRLNELENAEEYNLIYFDEDDIPELVTGVNGYYTSMYTYHNGNVYLLMDRWPYGAMGNAGYEYVPYKNSLRNYNSDFAGAIVYTTYMTIGEKYTMDVVEEIVTYNFDDSNGNGYPDADEEGSIGYYAVSYINGVQATAQECASYNVGEYEYIDVNMSLEDLRARLGEE